MAGPVAHVFCGLVLLNSQKISIEKPKEFFLGTNIPDIRYIADINRNSTHKIKRRDLDYLKQAESDFEAGRIFHVMVDFAREAYMVKHKAYDHIPSGPVRTQTLKLLEDDLLFSHLKDKFDPLEIFDEIYSEELCFGASKKEVKTWHRLLTNYLRHDHLFDFNRYYSAFQLFQNPKNLPKNLLSLYWYKIKKTAFFTHIYFRLQLLKRNQKLKNIILGFYNNPLNYIFPKQIYDLAKILSPKKHGFWLQRFKIG